MRLAPSVNAQEHPRSHGALEVSGVPAALRKRRARAVGDDAGDRDGGAKVVFRRVPEQPSGVFQLGQYRFRYPHYAEYEVAPLQLEGIEEEGGTDVGVVCRVNGAVGELPQDPSVDRPKAEVALLRHLHGLLDVVQRPVESRSHVLAGQVDDASGHETFASREEVHEAGPGVNELELHRLVPFPADVGRAPVLPGDQVADGLPRGAVPQEEGVALAGDAHAGGLLRVQVAAGQRL